MNPLAGRKWFSWTRLICVLGTVALVWLVLRKIDYAGFVEALRRTDVLWCGAAFAMYGVALTLQASRWHLALRAIRRAVHWMASWRLAMTGHFFFTVFFGMAGGDAAKSTFYARWFRHPLPEVIAAAPLDRGLSLAGALVLAVVTWLIATVSGGLDSLRAVSFQSPGFWVLAGITLAAFVGVGMIFWKPRGDSAWARSVRAFREGGGRMVLSPRLAASGLSVATLGHFALSAVFALNLQAVASTELSWAQMAWTVPAITTISCLPFTVAGAGVREIAAVTLLGLYAVPAADAVAASMLTMVHKLAWAGIGAGVLWREQSMQDCSSHVRPPETVSIIVPITSDVGADAASLRRLLDDPRVRELIVVTARGSCAGLSTVGELGGRVVIGGVSRVEQFCIGAKEATGDVLLFLHPNASLQPNAVETMLDGMRDSTVVAGSFGKALGVSASAFIRSDSLKRLFEQPDFLRADEAEAWRRLRKLGRVVVV